MHNRSELTRRADALDALRGIAVLMMVFSGLVPRNPPLPAWMYHAQVPPPDFTYNPDLPGFTWVDWVFPLFLFALGVSIPLALSRRLDRPIIRHQPWRIGLDIGWRWLELSAFAIVLQHLRPTQLGTKLSDWVWCLSILGFGLLTLAFTRWSRAQTAWLPIAIQPHVGWLSKAIGWLGIALILATQTFRNGQGFSVERQDVILMLLAVSALAGSIVWLLTRSQWKWRLSVLVLLLALRLSAMNSGWVETVWNIAPLPWLFRFEYLQYLFIVIPGTIAGDLIWRYQAPASTPTKSDPGILDPGALELTGLEAARFELPGLELGKPTTQEMRPQVMGSPRSRWRWWLICKMLGLLCLILLIGLQARAIVATTVISVGLMGVVWRSLPRLPQTQTNFGTQLESRLESCLESQFETLQGQLVRWGCLWLSLGLALEPFQGGIHKDPPTLSYFLISSGMSLFLLVILFVLLEYFDRGFARANFQSRRWLQLAIDNGKNPMVGYTVWANLLLPVLHLTNLQDRIVELTATPHLELFRAMFYTLLVSLITSGLLRLRCVWRTG